MGSGHRGRCFATAAGLQNRVAMQARTLRFAMFVAAMVVLTTSAAAQTKDEAEPPRDPAPELPLALLKNNDVIARGEKLWQDQCTHCHGAKAYPGKAPKLQPRLYKPEFVWDRTHNGFRGMPPWKDVYKPEEIVALVAYVLSDDFFP
ncbi:MAG TPA: cytochrome c [Hyphomicrobiaceae bacterium]|nr:cytochrome c [Hyphomicrobiaceae bacterium]